MTFVSSSAIRRVREVDERSRDRRGRDAAMNGDVAGVEVGAAMHLDARNRASRRHDDRERRSVAPHLPELGGCETVQRGAIAAGEHGREEFGIARERSGDERVDAAVAARQRPAPDARADRLACQSRREQIAVPEQAVREGWVRNGKPSLSSRTHPRRIEPPPVTKQDAFATTLHQLCVALASPSAHGPVDLLRRHRRLRAHAAPRVAGDPAARGRRADPARLRRGDPAPAAAQQSGCRTWTRSSSPTCTSTTGSGCPG